VARLTSCNANYVVHPRRANALLRPGGELVGDSFHHASPATGRTGSRLGSGGLPEQTSRTGSTSSTGCRPERRPVTIFCVLAHWEPLLLARLACRLGPYPVIVHVDASFSSDPFRQACADLPASTSCPTTTAVGSSWGVLQRSGHQGLVRSGPGSSLTSTTSTWFCCPGRTIRYAALTRLRRAWARACR
jgi:hypothetical protein